MFFRLKVLVGLSLLAVGALAGCTDAPMASEDVVEEFGQSEQSLCANGDGVGSGRDLATFLSPTPLLGESLRPPSWPIYSNPAAP